MGRAVAFAALLLALLLAASDADAQAVPAIPKCAVQRGETRAVARVLDGETLRLDDGRELRLAGALAPRASDVGATSGSWPPEIETRAALSAMVEGRIVTLWPEAVRTDRYGRLLAQVTVGDGADAIWLQGALVARGLARAYGRPGMDACSAALVALERPAREAGRGLWANPAYGGRPADDVDALARAVGSFQVLVGTVQRVSRGQGDVYLTMASRGRRDSDYPFAAVVPARGGTLIGGIEPRKLVGQRVTVRGWIEQRRGPVIVVDSNGQLELADE
jgi:micrococcal nuclease